MKAVRHLALAIAALIVLMPLARIAAAAFKTQIATDDGQHRFRPDAREFRLGAGPVKLRLPANFANSPDRRHRQHRAGPRGGDAGDARASASALPRLFAPALLGWSVLFHMVPPITLAGAWYVMFRCVGLDNTYAGLILAHATLNLPMALWMLLIFVQDVPREIPGSRADRRRVRPAAPRPHRRAADPPGLAAAGVLAFVFSWNEFAVTLDLSQRQTATVPIAIGKFAQENTINYTEMAAAALLATVPAVILLLLAQRFIVRGLTAGAVK